MTLFTMYSDNYQSLADLVLPNKQAYCARHGYKLHIDRTSNYIYHKLNHSRQRLSDDWVWCLDLDTIITNFDFKIVDFIDDKHDLFICEDLGGLNAGSYLVNQTAIDFLATQDQFPDEQTAIIKNRSKLNMKVLFHPSINSYLYGAFACERPHDRGDWQRGDFVLHMPSLTLEERLFVTRSFLKGDDLLGIVRVNNVLQQMEKHERN